MNYKLLFKSLLIGFIIFAVIVTFGIKFNWGKYMQPASQHDTLVVKSAKLATQSEEEESASESSKRSKGSSIGNFELIDENGLGETAEQQIRNDCIRASRRAGVTDDEILAVVNQCVEMSQTNDSGQAIPIETDGAPEEMVTEAPSISDSLELTRKACKIVADEEQDLNSEERLKVIEQCVKANMSSQ